MRMPREREKKKNVWGREYLRFAAESIHDANTSVRHPNLESLAIVPHERTNRLESRKPSTEI